MSGMCVLHLQKLSEFMLAELLTRGAVIGWSLCTKPYTQARL